jgi:lipoprotein LpqH
MQGRYAVATSLLVMGLAGCSSGPPSAPTPPNGALVAGTAQVIVNGKTVGANHGVECENLGRSFIIINIGRAGSEVTVLVHDATPQAISFNDVQGFTGSYWQDLQGSARLGMIDQTYSLAGTAAGYNADHPHVRTTDSFNVKVAC